MRPAACQQLRDDDRRGYEETDRRQVGEVESLQGDLVGGQRGRAQRFYYPHEQQQGEQGEAGVEADVRAEEDVFAEMLPEGLPRTDESARRRLPGRQPGDDEQPGEVGQQRPPGGASHAEDGKAEAAADEQVVEQDVEQADEEGAV